ncbi:ABC transporter substrate-binding protein [Bifidobacterium sp. ESL0784]|uniref:peptide ABC transporter substrate-binding protein n=1 Tax=Bifidobacterium sp. ESL0784 TaxID=2983231 RepID=UPI0023F7864F|nr:ABC transporter substrate-binding protein [Bifidobacterium sp. ESL0784]MDF7641147.1 ABC transporter substrate-binding protein [Bifidobacterium sp. ESL0784]
MKKKGLALAAVACSVAMLLSACGGSGSGSSSSSSSKGGSNIIIAYSSEPQNPLVPGNTNESEGAKPIQLAFSGLITFDSKGNPKNEVAQSITPNANSTQYTVKLKPGWKFTDGTPVTAESFTKAWSYTANAKNAQKGSSFFSTIKGFSDLQKPDGLKGDEQLSGLKIVDDKTFTVDMAQPDSTFPIKVGHYAFAPLPASFYKDPKAFGEKPVGDGPYKVVAWDHSNDIKLVKNKDYKGVQPVKNDGVTFKIYTKDDAAYADVQAGKLDVMETVPAADSKSFRTDSSVQPYNKPGSVNQMFTIPSDLNHFKSGTEEGTLRRQAISMAIDRKTIVNKILSGLGVPADDFTSPLTPGYKSGLKGSENLKYNPTKAKELWQKAEAISKDTEPLTFAYNADGGSKPIFDAVVNSINNALGSKVASTNPMPTFQQFRDAVGNHSIKGAFRSGWQPDYPSAENYLFQNFASGAADGNGSNDGGYKNPKFDALIDQAYAAKDQDTANGFYTQAQEILLNDLPAIPMYYKNNDGVASTKVNGFEMNWQGEPVYGEITRK